MNRTYTVTIAILAVLLIAAGAYAVYEAYHPAQVVVQSQSSGTTTTATTASTPPQAGLPIVQTNASTAPYISTVVVKGTVNPDGALTTYWYEFGQTTALGMQTNSNLMGSGYTNIYTPAYITGLKANTNYYFRLDAKNSFGTVEGTIYSFATNNTPPPQGTAPTTTTLAATDIARTTANVSGKINPNGSDTTYWFEYGTSAELGSVTAMQSKASSNSTSTVSISISNLQPLTKYYFRLNAQNQFGTVNGQILNFTTKGPASATAPAATTNAAQAITSSSATLTATVNPNGAATTYWFEYSTDSFVSHILVSSTPQQSLSSGNSPVAVSAMISGLRSNTKYYVKIVANNQYGTTQGDIQSFTTSKANIQE